MQKGLSPEPAEQGQNTQSVVVPSHLATKIYPANRMIMLLRYSLSRNAL